MHYRPIGFGQLAAELTERVLGLPGRVAVLVDGATGRDDLADALAGSLRVGGRETLRVSAGDFLRPASLRFEQGREDVETRYSGWTDFGALRREVLDPLRSSGEVLPALWDSARDRATRTARVRLAGNAVVVLDGELLLGRGLHADLTVHLWLSPAALRRKLPESEHWALPAYERYEREAHPAGTADVVVRADDPRHPAVRYNAVA